MSVNKKGKRKLVLNERTFYWYVKEDMEDLGNINLYIISDNKKFFVRYRVGQSKQVKSPVIFIQGTEFEGLKDVDKGLKRAVTPHWEDEIITPGLVKTIIEWCYAPKHELTFVDRQGNEGAAMKI
ncbi:hypothetical protein CLHUN_16870 [Ruminiclostridium hungatei]|uniref:Uncharacterized protein n=1 Tax=Ruminiclostridium hungatei TaxID=48256 RepID=A0A1V4SKG8_RUMHU|nr:hypothetical protein [Ruminiclostridium hungatei]OPX44388.1 hypothetical protein CLHUN_16870 [Ruminiclostridium hungatei]